MSVQIIINGDNANESIIELRTLAAALIGVAAQPVTVAPQQLAEKPTRQRNNSKVVDLKKEEAPAEKTQDSADDPIDATTEEPTDGEREPTQTINLENIPSIVDLRAKAQEKGKTAEGKQAVKALLNQYQCKSISDVPEEKRAAFYADLVAL